MLMVDLAAKVKAIHELTDTWAANGEVEKIDAVLAILSRRKRGPYKQQQWYRACAQGPAPLEEIVKRAQAFGPVPGETMEDKMKFVVGKMRQSPSVYREFEDGRWGIRRRPDDLHPAHHQSLSAQYDVASLHEVPEG
jgi:hypothetical protein